MMGLDQQMSQDSAPSAPCPLLPVALRLTHLDWNPEATLIHFQGQYVNTCELDYNILQKEIQNVPKTRAEVDIGEFCLVEDSASARWFRGRVQNRKENQFDVFLVDHGNVLSVDIAHITSCSSDLLILPPKIACGFLSNVLLLQTGSHSVMGEYLLSLIGRSVKGFIKAILPHSVILLEAPDINNDLVKHGFGRHVDTHTFLFLAEMLIEVPLKQNIDPGLDLLIEKPSGQKFKSSTLKGYEEFLSFCGPQLRCGTRAKVRVTAAFDPELFYCQMTNVKNDLCQMSKKLAQICEYRTEKHNEKTWENLGQLCAFKGKDGEWYRGFLQFLPVNSEVRVLLIDYGFFEYVHVENIHKLPLDFYSTSIMAFPCTLSSLIDQDTALKTQQLSLLKAGLLGGVLDVEVIGFDKECHLHTINLIGAEDKHVEESQPIQRLPTEPVFDTVKAPLQGGYAYYETVMAEALANTLKAEQVHVGSVFVGYVEYAQNPNHFWIRTQKRNDEFEVMMEKMADHFSHMELEEDILLNQEVGAKCCALYEKDRHFYRGVVTDTLEHGAEVLYIDFGNIEKVPHMLIKNVPETFASTSQFAVCCTLSNVFPFDDIWSSEACDLFRKAVSNKALQVHVVQVRKTKLVVDLLEVGSDNSIAELLISSNVIEYIPVDHMVQNKDLAKKTRRLEHTVDICGKSEQLDDCEKDKNLSKNEIDKVKATTSFRALSIKPGCEFPVRCSYINSPSDFWCQPLDKAPKLEKLMVELQQYYSAHTVPLQPGDLCCIAKSPHDGRWYRGFIMGKLKSHINVALVDFGSTIQVREHSLQAIMPGHVCLEGQAFRCSLYKLTEPADLEDWSPETCHLLTDFVRNSKDMLKCKVVSQLNVKNKGLCNIVNLYNTRTQQSIMDTIIEQRLARETSKIQSGVSPESFVHSSFDLSPENEEQVFVTHISSQCEVYCQLERNTEIVEELEKKISEELKKMMQANTGDVKKLCLSKYFDGKWYRALALPTQSALHLSVFFVDYGNTNISEISQVRFIPRDCVDLLCTPMQAVRCNLNSVPTEEFYATAKEWLNHAILNKVMKAVIHRKREDGSFDVELFDGEININEKLKELILSLSPKPKAAASFVKSSSATKQKRQQTQKQKTFKYKNAPTRQSSTSATNSNKNKEKPKKLHWIKNTLRKLQNENNPKNSSPIKPQIQVQGQGACRHAQSKTTLPTEERELRKASSSYFNKSLTAGFRVKCFTSHIDSVNSFFLQLSEDEPAILKMGENLNSDIFRDSLKKVTSSRTDDAVLAEFEEDGALYRSLVKTLEGSSSFIVEFVDYGNSAVIGKEKIFLLPDEYKSQPRFSIPCSLLDTSSFKNDASFIDAVMERPLMVVFVNQCGIQWKVKLEILDQDAGLETTLERSLLTENKEETTQSLPETEEETRSCAPNERSIKTATVEVPRPVTMPAKLKGKLIRLLKRRRTRNKNKRKMETSVKIENFSYSFLPPTIQARDTENATILSVQSDGSFYIRLTRTTDLLMYLETCVSDNIHKYKTVAPEDVKQGLKCLVQVQDKRWQRAVVLQENDEKSKVLLVDHGITKDIPRGSILQQGKDMKKFPNFAMLCKINSLGFSEGVDAHKYWCENLKPIISTEVRLVFIHYSEADNLWMVEMVLNGLFLTRQIKTPLQQNEEKIPSPTEARPASDTSPPQQLIFAHLDPDRAYSGVAAAVTTPFKFCVFLEDLLPIKKKVSMMLDNHLRETPPLPESHLVPGNCCLLKSDSRNKWCRAEIICANTTVVLKLVDHGEHECVPYCDFSNLKMLPVELANLPKVACPCILRGVKPVGADGQWTDEAEIFFQQLLYQKKLRMFFREFVSNSHWKVDILADGVHVAKELVDAGHADYMDILLGLRFQVESFCKPQGPDSEEEECSEVKTTDGPEWMMSINTDARSGQCNVS